MEKRINKIIEILDDKKALNIETFDLNDKGYVVDKVVIATSLNNKHTVALLAILKDELSKAGEEILRIQEDNDWSVLDMGDVMVHIMTQLQRELYNLDDFLDNFEV